MDVHQLVIFIIFIHYSSPCNYNQFLNPTTSICDTCPSLCNTCSNSTTCTSCPNGFYLNTGVCISCQPQCTACVSSTNCSSCSAPYFFESSSYSCVTCSGWCSQCNSASSCLKCSSDYFLSNSICVICNTNCTCDGMNQVCLSNSSVNINLLLLFILGPIITIATIILIVKYCCICCKKQNSEENIEQPQQQSYVTEEEIIRRQTFKILGVLLNKHKKEWICEKKSQAINKSQICSICLLDEVDTQTFCKHVFHFKCLLTWLEKKLFCPFCKGEKLRLKKYCAKCGVNYVQCKMNNLRVYLVQFYEVCIYCKSDFKRLDTHIEISDFLT